MTSRLFVQGLPNYVIEQRLREVFGEKGEVTDARIIRTRDGRSRQFGFVGFHTAQEAELAVKYFNNTYVDTQRIQVKFAEKTSSENLGRPWSKYTKEKEAAEAAKKEPADVKRGKKAYQPQNEEADPGLEEFLKVMQPRRAGKMWSNDDIAPEMARPAARGIKPEEISRRKDKPGGKAKAGGKKGVTAGDESAGDDAAEGAEDTLYQDLTVGNGTSSSGSRLQAGAKLAKKVEGRTGKEKKRGKPQTDEEEPDNAVRAVSASEAYDAFEENGAPGIEEAASDMDYLKSRMTATFDAQEDRLGTDISNSERESSGDEESGSSQEAGTSDDDDEGAGTEEASPDEEGVEAEEADTERKRSHAEATTSATETGAGDGSGRDQASIAKTGRLFLRNLSYMATEADLRDLFQTYGDLSEVHLVIDRATGKSKGFALVQFMEPQNAVAAHTGLDGSIFQGRLLHILPARPLPSSAGHVGVGKLT